MELGNAKANNFFSKSTDNKWYIESFTVDEKDMNSAVAILASQVPENSIVLDVGCAQGKFGGYLHDVKGCKMYGVEINEAALEYVKGTGKYEDVFGLNIEQDQESQEYLRFDKEIAEVDCIIISDVLEHLVDPTSTVRKMGRRLKQGGKILISVPNIGHADIYLNLMNGMFNYSDLGILDNTHLKFFTKRSFFEWIKDMNTYYADCCFDCEFLGGTFYYSDYLWSVKENCKPLFNIIETNPDFNILQLLFVLTKVSAKAKTPTLDAMLSEPVIDTVRLVNNALIENMQGLPHGMYAGERQWYEGRLEHLSEQVQSLIIRNSEQERDILWMKEQNANMELLLAQKTAELASILRSWSWRLTGPLRWMRHFVR
jgi:2-polyprenyl-3-methyl-5-hydroxy-6-metoxy-1,4-benzoquinol methylase